MILKQLWLFKVFVCIDCGVHTCAGAGTRVRKLRCDDCRRRAAVLRAAEWARANPEKTVRHTANRYVRKRDQMKAATERWRRNNPNKVRDLREARRARVRDAFVEYVDRAVLHAAYEGRCGICAEPVALDEMELDHIVPLSRGGLHQYSNCQPAHQRCNRVKHTKLEAPAWTPRRSAPLR